MWFDNKHLMNKLFVFQDDSSSKYATELECAFKLFDNDKNVKKVTLSELTIESLQAVDVVVSNKLSLQWQLILSGLKIVSIVIDEIDKKDVYTDIYIDYLYNGYDKFFIGENYSICNNFDPKINFPEIFNLISSLPWDTKFFGFPIAFLSSRHLTENILYRVNKYLKKEKLRLVEYLCNCHDKRSVQLAEANNFEF